MEDLTINNILNNPSDIEALFSDETTEETSVQDKNSSIENKGETEETVEEKNNNLENNITESPKSI